MSKIIKPMSQIFWMTSKETCKLMVCTMNKAWICLTWIGK